MERRLPREGRANQAWGIEEIIRTKLFIPNARENWVKRPRLLKRLDESIHHTLTLLVAPAGYGKTSLLSDWVHERMKADGGGLKNERIQFHPSSHPSSASSGQALHDLNFAWISLDERDNDLERFITYLVAALETLEIHTEDRFWSAGRVRQEDMEAVMGILVNCASEIPDDFFLVLDDFQVITDAPVFAALAFLISHLPPQMHLILSSRAEPALPLGQLRARGQLLEIRAADLRFTLQEAGAFLKNAMGLDLPEEAISALEARTEGWIAGLQLAALSMRGRGDALDLLQAFTGSHRYIVDYLADQVLHQQSEELQNFLLESSILGRLSSANCGAILGKQRWETQEILEYLEKSNLFLLPLDHDRQWYRYHPLFASFLRDRLRRSNPERWSELHRKAVDWFETNGWIAEAVDHALAIGDNRQAVDLVEQIVEAIWMKGEMARLWGWLQALPHDLVRARPRLCIFHAWISNIKGEPEIRDKRLLEAEDSLEQGNLPEGERDMFRGMLAALHAIISIMKGDAGSTFEQCMRALEHLPEQNLVWRCLVYRNLGNAYLLENEPLAARLAFREAYETSLQAGNIYMALISMCELGELDITLGRLRHAERTFRSAIELAAERGAPGLTITGAHHTGLSEVLRQWNRLEEGMQHARSGIELGLLDGSLGVRLCGYTRLAAISRALGNEQEAEHALENAMALAPTLRQTAFVAHMELQGQLWWLQGDLGATQRWLEESGLHLDGEISCLNETGYLTLARLLMHSGRIEEARDLLARLRQSVEYAGRKGRLIEVLALQAMACSAKGDSAAAMAAMEEGFLLAKPEGYLRIFLDEGEPMKALINDFKLWIENQIRDLSNSDGKSLRSYVDQVLAAFSQGSTINAHENGQSAAIDNRNSSGRLLHETLSERELEVLQLIAAGLSNHEIARELVLATSTVHWHTKNIYSKLNVHSRTQATWQARQLGLVH